jgi:predicted Rossmann-fold nucleotide-binding protein
MSFNKLKIKAPQKTLKRSKNLAYIFALAFFLLSFKDLPPNNPSSYSFKSTENKKLKDTKPITEKQYSSIKKKLKNSVKQMLKEIRYLKKQNKPIVSFFGGHNVDPKSDYYKKAYLLSNRLAKEGCLIITGGGQGIMKAANCGGLVNEQEITSIAIGVKGLGDPNSCAQKIITLGKFFPRKLLLVEHSSAIVIFPGGMGTLDELTDIAILIQIKEQPNIPIYIVGMIIGKTSENGLKMRSKQA